jgi:hypothetical protein
MGRKTDSASVFVASRPTDPELLLAFHYNTAGLPDAAIVDQVRYVAADDPDIPREWVPPMDLGEAAARKPGYRFRIALWADGACALIYFPIFQFEPRPQALICAYHYARQIQQVMKLQQHAFEGSLL